MTARTKETSGHTMDGQRGRYAGDEWVERYCEEWDQEHRAKRRSLRKGTRAVYAAIWRSYLRVLADRGTVPSTAGAEDARAFLRTLQNPTTRLRHGRLVKSICERAVDRGDAQENPFEDLASLTQEEERAPVVTLQVPDIEAVIASLPVPRDWKEQRDHALIVLAIAAGLRLKELRELEVHQIHPDTVQPAGGTVNARVIPLPPAAREYIQDWLSTRRAAGTPGLLAFPTKKGTLLPVNTLYRRTRRVLEQLYGKSALPHFGFGVLRAAFAATLKNPARAQYALGHKQITSTLRYLDQLKATRVHARKLSGGD